MTHLPISSTVLQRRRGYRDVLRHFLLLRLATRHLPLSTADARDLLEAKDIARLYELWCYFRVVEELTAVAGDPVRADRVRASALEAGVGHGFEVQWPSGLRALYNLEFSKSSTKAKTYSVRLRPDIVVVLPDGAVHILDAKFRIERVRNSEDVVAKDDDLTKMHAYRDAIARADSAWVLFPGTVGCEHAADATAAGVNGVGAIPLRPEADGGEALRGLLARLATTG